MRLNEFYNPELDNFIKRSKDDTRKVKLTLSEINKLRKVREIKKAEEVEHKKFVKMMYANPTDQAPTL
tara:strand:+ start:1217 stop:1420 length:204 start_codon:yes stop_codon:yes gene_type:complete